MMVEELKALLQGNRSYRRFSPRKVTKEELETMIGTASLVGSAGNLQGLRFVPVTEEETCAAVYSTLGWAGYLPTWDGPVPDERPTAYLVMVARPDAVNFNTGIDVGICAQSILLTARTMGLGGCMLRNIKKAELSHALSLPEGEWDIVLVIALGEPKEKVVLVPMENGDVRYYRDADGIHYVPKRATKDFILPVSEKRK